MSEEAATDVVAFITARLDEDEAAASATAIPLPAALNREPNVGRLNWRTDVSTDDDGRIVGHGVISAPDVAGVAGALGLVRGSGAAVAVHIARHDPARSLREVQVLREVVFELQVLADLSLGVGPEVARLLLRKISEIWSDHPAYRTWLPVAAP